MFTRYESLPRYLKLYPITSILIGICLILFLLMTFTGSSTSVFTLYEYGAFYAESVKEGEWYRFLSANFIHIGWMHLLMNVAFLYIFAPWIEMRLGKIRYLLFFMTTGVCSFILPYFYTDAISAGASGSLFGIMGMYLFLIQYEPHRFSPQDKQLVIALVIIDFIFSFLTPNISILGHVGGFISGWILSFVFLAKWKK